MGVRAPETMTMSLPLADMELAPRVRVEIQAGEAPATGFGCGRATQGSKAPRPPSSRGASLRCATLAEERQPSRPGPGGGVEAYEVDSRSRRYPVRARIPAHGM